MNTLVNIGTTQAPVLNAKYMHGYLYRVGFNDLTRKFVFEVSSTKDDFIVQEEEYGIREFNNVKEIWETLTGEPIH